MAAAPPLFVAVRVTSKNIARVLRSIRELVGNLTYTISPEGTAEALDEDNGESLVLTRLNAIRDM